LTILAFEFTFLLNFKQQRLLAAMENTFDARLDVNFYQWDEQILNLAKGTQDILKILFDSKEHGNTVAVKSQSFGDGLVVTAVEDIILAEDGETIILFKPFDATGSVLPTNKVRLADIDAACPLISEFKNPVLRNIDKDRSWFF
jgi:hypothetical protein